MDIVDISGHSEIIEDLYCHSRTFMDINGHPMRTSGDFGHLRKTEYFDKIWTDSLTFEDI